MKPSRRSSLNLLAVAVVATLGVSACTSDPSAKRVAKDLVETLTQDEPEVRDCMIKVIDGYSASELDDIGNDARDGDVASQKAADVALEKFEADLVACRD